MYIKKIQRIIYAHSKLRIKYFVAVLIDPPLCNNKLNATTLNTIPSVDVIMFIIVSIRKMADGYSSLLSFNVNGDHDDVDADADHDGCNDEEDDGHGDDDDDDEDKIVKFILTLSFVHRYE